MEPREHGAGGSGGAGGGEKAEGDGPALLARFTVRGDACPNLLCRLAGLFAQQGLVPLSAHLGRSGGTLLIEFAQDMPDERRAILIAEKMRAIVTVSDVSLRLERIA